MRRCFPAFERHGEHIKTWQPKPFPLIYCATYCVSSAALCAMSCCELVVNNSYNLSEIVRLLHAPVVQTSYLMG